MMARREFLIGGIGLGLLASCGPAGPGSVTVVATGAAGMNPGADGADRPLTLQIVQLSGGGAFDSADFFALQTPAAALGADLVKADQIALAPGGTATKTIGLEPGVSLIGVIAGYRDPGGKVFRAKTAVSATEVVTLQVTVGTSGITLARG
jgi:type VI secretion system protein VasD